jgi:lysophospholipase L1-like esterase
VINVNVVLIGDSIRLFYEENVKSRLGDEYKIYSPKENCRFSSYVLNSLRFWLAEYPTPDIIHFNAGLWDSAILYKEDGCFIGVTEYVENMKKILRVLKSTGAKIIFATTTPVSDEKENLAGPMPPAHKNEDVIRYNKAVLEAFKDEDIYINDLFSLMYNEKEKYLSEDMIHPNEDGVNLLGNAVAQAILSCPVLKTNHSEENVHKMDFCEKTIQ